MNALKRNFVLRKIEALDKQAAFALTCLVQIAVFALDHVTGPFIPLGPYYLIPISLASWCLGIPSIIVFVAVSSLLRTYGLSALLPANALGYMAGDFFCSVLIYGAAAFFVRRIRLLYNDWATYAGKLEDQVRRAEQWHHLESGIRRAVPQDADAILKLAVVGAEDGDLSKDVLNAVRQETLRMAFLDTIQRGVASRATWAGKSEVVPVEFWVLEADGKIAGFFEIMGIDQRLGAERELHAIAVAREFRGSGVGTAMVDFFCSHYYGRRLFAACMPESRIHQMLRKRGFYHASDSKEGYVIVERIERPREKGLLHDIPERQDEELTHAL